MLYPQDSAYIKAMIKIANPTWTSEEIQQEYERKLKEIKEDSDNCQMCSG